MRTMRWVLGMFAVLGCTTVTASAQDATQMGFFITSTGLGKGANLGGLAGADQHCQALATAAGSKKTWRAYLSTVAENGKKGINARDRIGRGPWKNVKGVVVATSIDNLHDDKNNMTKETELTEKGETVKGSGDMPNTHDILTGASPDERTFPGDADMTCKNWTSETTGSAQVGHFDRTGGGLAPTSWNSSHASRGCSQQDLVATGGADFFYCFATN